MRLALAALLIISLAAAGFAVTYRQQNSELEQQVADLSVQAEKLLNELDQNTRQRLENENRTAQLAAEVSTARGVISQLQEQLTGLREQIDPDLQQLEDNLRERLDREYRRQLADATAALENRRPTVASMISQMGSLSNEERMALIGVQGEFGGFLESLDVSEERKETITQALVDLNLSRSATRRDLARQQLEPQEMADQMMALMSPEATREILAYDLTDEELAAFDEFQEQRQNTFFSGPVGERGVFMIRGEGAQAPNIIRQDGTIVIEPGGAPGQTEQFIFRGVNPAVPIQ